MAGFLTLLFFMSPLQGAVPPSAEQARDADDSRLLQQKQGALAPMATTVRGLLQQLEALRRGYGDKRRSKRLARDREVLRAIIMEFKSIYAPAAEEFAGRGLQDKCMTAAANQALDLKREIDEVLFADQAAFESARRSASLRRNWILAAAALACVLAGGFIRRRSGRAGSSVVPPGPTSVPAPLPLEGVVFARNYRIGRELDWGSMGFAFEAEDLIAGRRVVLKRVRDELHEDLKGVAWFLEYSHILAGLKHPNIAEFHSAFIEAGRVHLCVESYPGEPLARLLGPGGCMDPAMVQRVLRQVAAALDYGHSRGVLHGDVSPANISISKEGLVKVSDFGVWVALRRMAAKHSWRGPVGSAAYMAPEQELGLACAGSDIYSMGVVLYEMATGRLPFEGPNLLAQKRETSYVAASRAAAGMSPEIDSVVAKALQPEPRDRFRSAGEFSRALDAWVSGCKGMGAES